MTVLEALIPSLSRAGEYNRDDQVAPAVILWPDKERQWEPELTISSAAPVVAEVAITSAKWVGLRCRVQASASAAGLLADIRESIADKATSLVAKPKEIEADGQTSLLVSDDRQAGKKAIVVLVDASDNVVAQFPTVIGE